MFDGMPVIAAGLLIANATSGEHAQNITGAVAVRTSTAGKWNIDLNGQVFNPERHILIGVPSVGVSVTPGGALTVFPGLQGDGVTLAIQEGIAGTFTAADKAMQFVIVQRPAT